MVVSLNSRLESNKEEEEGDSRSGESGKSGGDLIYGLGVRV